MIMEKAFSQTSEKISNYAIDTFKPEDSILKEVKDRSAKLNIPLIQVNNMDGLHLELLIRISKAKKIVEVGTLAGYSGICIARGIQNDGILHTIELEQKHADAAKESFQKAGVSHLIKQHVGPGIEMLKSIEKEGPFDAIFIDADKVSYPKYLTWAEDNLKVGGLIIGDNTFAWGNIYKENIEDPELNTKVIALREFNSRLANSSKFRSTILPTGEGLTVAIKVS
ncbi:O-methyltransferase [Silvanigrella paludirubra]|uniref:O-methyltransferase n=2 Tax=Silvanigrella paludirubra TaxID=2499159 RepID=A0A6N6VTG5_9BACT|nr:O-methyltransferase [Silvanigrella paludirubra]